VGIKAPSISGIVETYSKLNNDWLKILKPRNAAAMHAI
jgi:hypothetical protein